MTSLTRTKKLFLIMLLVNIVIFSAYGLFFFLIQRSSFKTLDAIASAQNELEKERSLRATKNILQANAESISKLDTFFVASEGVPSFLESLESLGKQASVTLNVASVSAVDEAKDKNSFKQTLKLKIEMEGTYGGVTKALSLIENLNYPISIDQTIISIDGSGDSLAWSEAAEKDRKANTWNLTADITLFKFK